MLNRRQKQFFSNILMRPTTLSFFGLLIIIVISVPLFKNISKQYEINREISSLQQEIKNFENQNSDLKKTFEYLESDQFAAEQARKNLNYKKEGEEVVVIKAVTNKTNSTSEVNTLNLSSEIKPNNPVLWWRYFFY